MTEYNLKNSFINTLLFSTKLIAFFKFFTKFYIFFPNIIIIHHNYNILFDQLDQTSNRSTGRRTSLEH